MFAILKAFTLVGVFAWLITLYSIIYYDWGVLSGAAPLRIVSSITHYRDKTEPSALALLFWGALGLRHVLSKGKLDILLNRWKMANWANNLINWSSLLCNMSPETPLPLTGRHVMSWERGVKESWKLPISIILVSYFMISDRVLLCR